MDRSCRRRGATDILQDRAMARQLDGKGPAGARPGVCVAPQRGSPALLLAAHRRPARLVRTPCPGPVQARHPARQQHHYRRRQSKEGRDPRPDQPRHHGRPRHRCWRRQQAAPQRQRSGARPPMAGWRWCWLSPLSFPCSASASARATSRSSAYWPVYSPAPTPRPGNCSLSAACRVRLPCCWPEWRWRSPA